VRFLLLLTSRRADIFCRRERDWVLGEFKAGHSPILIATDVASRGLGMCSLTVASAPTLRRDTMVTDNWQVA
jgi:hypothetical protein